MKMGWIEKRLVNATGHSRSVAAATERSLAGLPLQPGQRYLDVGCGNGVATRHVAEVYGLEVTGVDVDPGQIALARAAAGTRARFETADATRLPFPDGAFDLVATRKTLHHVPAWETAIAEMVRVLGPCGHLVIEDLVLPPWLAAIGRRVAGGRAGLVTEAALERRLEAHGLGIIRRRSSGPARELVCRRCSAGAVRAGAGFPGLPARP